MAKRKRKAFRKTETLKELSLDKFPEVSKDDSEASQFEASETAVEKREPSYLQMDSIEDLETEIEDVQDRHELRGQELVELRKRLQRAEHVILNTEQRLQVFAKHVRDLLRDLNK